MPLVGTFASASAGGFGRRTGGDLFIVASGGNSTLTDGDFKIHVFIFFLVLVFGFFFKIYDVRFPVPGPISKTRSLSLNPTTETIRSITPSSIKKFWPNRFLVLAMAKTR